MAMMGKIKRAMDSGKPLDMARASYAYSRAHGLTRREAFAGAWELFWEYRAKTAA